MTNSLNIPAAELKRIERLTADQLRAIRTNLQDHDLSDDAVRDAMMEAVADGHDVSDFLG